MSAATSVELVVAHVAALRLGLVVVPVNGAYRAREIDHIVGDCTPAACVVDDRPRARWSPTSRPAAGRRHHARGRPARRRPAPVLDARRPTTSRCSATRRAPPAPRRARCSPTATRSRAARRCGWRGAGPTDDRLVLALPLFHVHGLGVGLHGTLLARRLGGAPPAVRPRRGARRRRTSTTRRSSSACPRCTRGLASSERVAELARLRLCVSGSAPLPAALHDDAHGPGRASASSSATA